MTGRPRKAKIVCTLGPASSSLEQIRRLAQAGMDVARLNFSHGTHEGHAQAFADVRRVSGELNKPIAILADLCGPKIRVGTFTTGDVTLEPGQSFVVTSDEIEGTNERVSVNYQSLPREVEPGMALLIDDGLLRLRIERIQGSEIQCRVEAGGVLKSRKGVNIPDASLSTPAITEKDLADIVFAKQLGVDYFALSFVRTPDDVRQAQREAGDIPVIAKIEKPQAIERLEEIAEVADGLMVARGDLAVEAGAERVPVLQKRMIRMMNAHAKPVITATQMLESMVRNPVPTRAEVSDVANAVLDGTDAVMLSAETASGQYPVESVSTMARIVAEVESSPLWMPSDGHLSAPPSFGSVIAHSAARAAIDLRLRAVAVFSKTGRSVALVSAYRPPSAIVAFSRNERHLPRLALLWGVTPILGEYASGTNETVYLAEKELRKHGLVRPGDEIAVTFGRDEGDGVGAGTTIMRLWRVRDE